MDTLIIRAKFVFIFLLIVLVNQQIAAQSYYKFAYKSASAKDTTTYNAFFVIYDNGSGLVRVNYISPATNKITIVELEIQESYGNSKDGTIDTAMLMYEGMNPKIIAGDSKSNFKPVVFWFRKNSDLNQFEPWGITASISETVNPDNLFTSTVITPKLLTDTAFVLNYFIKKDVFYENRFGTRSKGIGILTDEEKKTRLLLLIVASTNDAKVGKSAVVDAKNVIKTFTDVADFLNLKTVVDSVYGNNYGRASVEKALKKLNAIQRPTDIVIFYYSGHGFTDSLKPKMNYPFLDLLDPQQKPRPSPYDSTLNIEDIYTRIKNKPGRFKLVISDCCNDKIVRLQKDSIVPQPVKKDVVSAKWNWPNVYNLFMKERFSMLVTSASKGEGALGEDIKGGVYTNALLSTLRTNLFEDKPNPVWAKILAEAQKQTVIRINKAKLPCPIPFLPNNTCRQTPPAPKLN